jgi:hypothetical protein
MGGRGCGRAARGRVDVTTRIAHRARALPTWAVWVSYAVAVLCLSGFWGADMAAVQIGGGWFGCWPMIGCCGRCLRRAWRLDVD